MTAAEADWLAWLPKASPDEQDAAVIELRAGVHRTKRKMITIAYLIAGNLSYPPSPTPGPPKPATTHHPT